MIAKLRAFMATEVFKYLFFGVLATLVYMVSRTLIFQFTQQGTLSAVLANAIAIIFAFFTNDTFVFKQQRKNWFNRLIKFTSARLITFLLDLLLTFIFVTSFPQIIGYFVGNDINTINTVEIFIAQVTMVVLNYVFSKLFVFKNK